jgi:hypothetical protein
MREHLAQLAEVYRESGAPGAPRHSGELHRDVAEADRRATRSSDRPPDGTRQEWTGGPMAEVGAPGSVSPSTYAPGAARKTPAPAKVTSYGWCPP